MRTFTVLLLCFANILFAEAQDKKLIGTWNITECAYLSANGTEKIMEDQIKAGTATTDYFIMEDGSYKMTSNMSGSGTLDTFEGKWKTSDNNLIMTITVNSQPMEIVWKYEFKDNFLALSRTSPDGSMTIVNTYKKK
jgi:hypothetical protein